MVTMGASKVESPWICQVSFNTSPLGEKLAGMPTTTISSLISPHPYRSRMAKVWTPGDTPENSRSPTKGPPSRLNSYSALSPRWTRILLLARMSRTSILDIRGDSERVTLTVRLVEQDVPPGPWVTVRVYSPSRDTEIEGVRSPVSHR